MRPSAACARREARHGRHRSLRVQGHDLFGSSRRLERDCARVHTAHRAGRPDSIEVLTQTGRTFMGKRIDLNAVPVVTGSGYPAPFDAPCAARMRQRLVDAAGLTDFGVNLLRLPAGAWSSQRHWHSAEDEFVFVLDGEVVLVT